MAGLVADSRFRYAPVVICSNCGTENRPGRKFCAKCAAALAVVCPSAAPPTSRATRFCGECATPLTRTRPRRAIAGVARVATAAPSRQRSADAPVAERRLVSILFADLVGFTTLAEGRDAEETRELLTRYFDLAARRHRPLRRHRREVHRRRGDGRLGRARPPTRTTPSGPSGPPSSSSTRSGRSGPAIQARAGVLTGEAAVTLGATNQGMVAGDLVNTASAGSSRSPRPGPSSSARRPSAPRRKAIAFEPAGEQTLKGKARPVPAWRALRVVAEVGGRNRAETLEAPFVGRDDELRLLKDLFHATSREQRARLVSVIGPAGIGKTRLAWEFLKYVDGLVETVWWHDGRSPAYGDGISFWALGEMVRERCRPARDRRRADDPGEGRRDARDARPRRRRAALDRAGAPRPARASSRGDRLGAALRRLADVLRAAGRDGPGRHGLRGLPLRRRGPASTSSTTSSSGAGTSRSTSSRCPGPSCSRSGRTGAPASATSPRSTSSRSPSPRCASSSPASCRACPAAAVAGDRRPRRRHPALRRRDGPDARSPRAGSRSRTASTTRSATSTTLAVPETLTALIASRLDGLGGRATGRSSPTPPSSARASRSPASRPSRGSPRRSSSRACGRSSGASCSPSRPTRARPERGQYALRPGADPRGRLQHARQARPQDPPPRRGPLLRGASAPTSWPAPSPATTSRPTRTHRRGRGRRPRRPGADRAPGRRRASRGLGRHDQAIDFFEQALTVTTDPGERAELLERAGAVASAASRHADSFDFPQGGRLALRGSRRSRRPMPGNDRAGSGPRKRQR